VAGMEGEYIITFPKSLGDYLSYLRVVWDDEEQEVTVSGLDEEQHFFDDDGNYNFALDTGDLVKTKFIINAAFTNKVKPFPSEMTQHENQYLKYSGDSVYFFSVYPTEKQNTNFRLNSDHIESYSPKNHPALSVVGPNLVSSSKETIQPLKYIPLEIHYQSNIPFPVATSCIREIEFSPWGNVAVEEYYALKNAGADLKGGFSRVSYMMKRNTGANSFRELRAILPKSASNIYYRDQIGNISSSSLKHRGSDVLEMGIEPRFPLFGGWKTEFYLGYNVPVQNLVTHMGNKFFLRTYFASPFPELWVEDLHVKIVLPAGATNISANCEFTVETTFTDRMTFLDTESVGSRPVLNLKKKNVIAEHNQPLTIEFEYDTSLMYMKPGLLAFAFLCFYLFFIVYRRISLELPVPKTKKH